MFAQHALRFRISLPFFAQFVECDVYIFVHRLELVYCDEQQLGVSDGESHPSELSFRFRLPHSICDAHCERLFVAFAVCHALPHTLWLAVAVVVGLAVSKRHGKGHSLDHAISIALALSLGQRIGHGLDNPKLVALCHGDLKWRNVREHFAVWHSDIN